MTVSKADKARRAAAAAKAATSTPPASSETITAPAVKETKGAGGVKETTRAVVVVCKLPRGLYLQLTEFVNQDVRVVGGGVEKRQMPMRVGPQVRLKPSVLPFGAIPNYPIVEGFSLTRDVDANFWRQYAEQNKGFTMITEGLLAGFDTEADATAYCREFAKLKHGLEPLLQKDDPRIEKSFNPNVSDLDIDTDTPRPKVA